MEAKVNKTDYEVYEFLGGQFGICLNGESGGGCIFGGDSACEDHYKRDYIQSVYDAWDGVLIDGNIVE